MNISSIILLLVAATAKSIGAKSTAPALRGADSQTVEDVIPTFLKGGVGWDKCSKQGEECNAECPCCGALDCDDGVCTKPAGAAAAVKSIEDSVPTFLKGGVGWDKCSKQGEECNAECPCCGALDCDDGVCTKPAGAAAAVKAFA